MTKLLYWIVFDCTGVSKVFSCRSYDSSSLWARLQRPREKTQNRHKPNRKANFTNFLTNCILLPTFLQETKIFKTTEEEKEECLFQDWPFLWVSSYFSWTVLPLKLECVVGLSQTLHQVNMKNFHCYYLVCSLNVCDQSAFSVKDRDDNLCSHIQVSG